MTTKLTLGFLQCALFLWLAREGARLLQPLIGTMCCLLESHHISQHLLHLSHEQLHLLPMRIQDRFGTPAAATQSAEKELTKLANGAVQNGAPQDEDDSPDWRRVLPHVITAAFANFCFGYHIG